MHKSVKVGLPRVGTGTNRGIGAEQLAYPSHGQGSGMAVCSTLVVGAIQSSPRRVGRWRCASWTSAAVADPPGAMPPRARVGRAPSGDQLLGGRLDHLREHPDAGVAAVGVHVVGALLDLGPQRRDEDAEEAYLVPGRRSGLEHGRCPAMQGACSV